jgi:hypothetical protein
MDPEKSSTLSEKLATGLFCCCENSTQLLSSHTCDLAVRVPGYRSKSPGFDSRGYQTYWEVVGLERGPLSLMSITEELLEWKISGSGSRKSRLTAVEIRCDDHATPSIHKSWY